MIEVGREAPDFCLAADNDEIVCRKDLKGKWMFLYFYPKDNTSG
jgi:thioredoxin-dependent peroxiredoxin